MLPTHGSLMILNSRAEVTDLGLVVRGMGEHIEEMREMSACLKIVFGDSYSKSRRKLYSY